MACAEEGMNARRVLENLVGLKLPVVGDHHYIGTSGASMQDVSGP